MTVLIGAIIVLLSVLGGFMLGGGHVGALLHLSEWIIIGGAALGALVIMSPRSVMQLLLRQSFAAFKGAPHSRRAYEELFKALYELFMLGRRNGMIALEEHVLQPNTSSILTRYPSLLANRNALSFLCDGLRPIIDGKIKPDQLKLLMDIEMHSLEEEDYQPVGVLMKAADAMPAFGIVAAVMGIVITMGSIAGPIEEIGHKVASALVGTFLGIFIAYGFMHPFAANIEFINTARMAYYRCIAAAVIAFANGMAPIMAVEIARRGLNQDVKPDADRLEAMLKSVNPTPKS
jgi:chemotaxis protein MotA